MLALEFWINGKKHIISDPDPTSNLITVLRDLGYTGTKLGCSEGGCGSCTVVVSFYDHSQSKLRHLSVNSCLAPACSIHGKHVTTVEGIGSVKALSALQETFANAHGSQCGFCTPGFICSLYALDLNCKKPDCHEIEEAISGNLCRCTSYRPIIQGSQEYFVRDIEDLDKIKLPAEFIQSCKTSTSFAFKKNNIDWYHPSTREELLELVEKYPHAKIVHGNTEVGIEMAFKNARYPVFIYPSDIAELKQFSVCGNTVDLGALITIADLQANLKQLLNSVLQYQKRSIEAILSQIQWFAGSQVRNVSALSGNIVTASPISDLNPVWIALNATLELSNVNGTRLVKAADFFVGYRKTALKSGEILSKVSFDLNQENEYILSFKQSKRKEDDIAIVNASMYIKLESNKIASARLVYGGMAPTTVIAKRASEKLIGQSLNLKLDISNELLNDFNMSASTPGGQVEYRKALAVSFFVKFLIQTISVNASESVDSRIQNVGDIPRPDFNSVLEYEETDSIIGKSHVHMAAVKQTTGEAIYIDDIPKFKNELYAAMVVSTEAHANILSVDTSAALALEGVVDYIDYRDIPNKHSDANIIGPVFKDEELFPTKTVVFHGQMIGLILATSQSLARYASKLVKISYEKLPAVFTIEDAIAKQSFFSFKKQLKSGSFATENSRPAIDGLQLVTGQCRISGQEHFYLETNCSVVVPKKEDDELEIFTSSQNPSETQHICAHVMGIDSNRINVRVKRLGGGFGGKETRSVFLSCALAVAASKHSLPVRCMLTREEDMAVSGNRHPFLVNYTVGVDNEGKMYFLEADLYSNAGYSMDLSLAVMERAMTHIDNCYSIPNVKLNGTLCKTNLPTNTAFRGFGGPQGMMAAETFIEHVADAVGKSGLQVRLLNLYKINQPTHFNQPLEEFYIDKLIQKVLESSDYEKRLVQVVQFNRKNKYKKRGICLIPTKFGLAFTARFLNQAGALVHVYTDGSVLLTHGGTEMGQGLHTKMIQIAANALNIPITKVHLSETSTSTVANTSATAASVSSDLNGMAVLDACQQIMSRLAPFLESGLKWEEAVKKAYFDRVNLSANGFYKTPDLNYDWNTNTGRMFNYFTYGAACTEVEIDTLTGDHVVLRSDLAMDIGKSMNPAIDIGQIEGAFLQGQGWCTIEEPLVSPTTGMLLTRGPGTYKIPAARDVPADFRVLITKNSRNLRAIHSSKAVGEPPLFLGSSVFYAIRQAIKAARLENGVTDYLQLDCPATSERIRLACQDRIVQQCKTEAKSGELPWSIRS